MTGVQTCALPISDDDGEYGFKVQKRISKEIAKTKRERTEKEQALARAEALERELAETRKAWIAANEAAIKRDLEVARAKHSRAFSEGDAEEVTAATAEMAALEARRAEVQRAAQQVPQQAPQPARPQFSEKTQAFIEDNPWFDNDSAARELAINLHSSAVRKGLQPDTTPYFDFIKKSVKAAFPEHFEPEAEEEEEDEPAVKSAPVAPARRTVPGAAPAKAKLPSLTAEEAQIAERLGLSLKDYALEKLKLMRGNK